ncbi:MAG: urease accessory protein UreD [Polaromonas sp.]|nr:urease accessory protein UreD [Polaromonas sp.]
MSWYASLSVDYDKRAAQTVAMFKHSGPLRILQSLYPEGEGICHNVIVHPPGGLVGGDTLDLRFNVATGAHALVTTPGATRFYRSDGALARQHAQLQLGADARLEWLPLETIAYGGCLAENRLTMALEPEAELIGWDVTAFGLPAANLPFDASASPGTSGAAALPTGQFSQHIEVPGVWLERARIRASDALLLNSPLGLAGHRCMASMFWVTGNPLGRARRQLALDTARDVITAHPLRATAGATSPNGQVVVVRVLAPMVEPALTLLKQVRNAWRAALWQLPGVNPRIWAV